MALRIFTEGLHAVPEIQKLLTMDKEDFLEMDHNKREEFLARVNSQFYDMPISPNLDYHRIGKHSLAKLRYANFREAHESLSAAQLSM